MILMRSSILFSLLICIFDAGVLSFVSTLKMSSDNDLYIVGAGYLGIKIGQRWRSMYPEASIFGETRTDSKHSDLLAAGIIPVIRTQRESKKHSNVVFCASPSGNENYAEEVKLAATNLWNSSAAGCFVFTSSGGIYAEKSGGIVKELSPVGNNPRNQRLIQAEAACLEFGGCVIRLAGLYSLERGAHSYWLARGKVDAAESGLINLLAYDDAAGAVVACLEHSGRALTLLANDLCIPPMTRFQICEKALQHPMYASKSMPEFSNPENSEKSEDMGKVYDCSSTRSTINWNPTYKSFSHYIDEMMEQSVKES